MFSLIDFVKTLDVSQDFVLVMYYISTHVVYIKRKCNYLNISNEDAQETSHIQNMRIPKLHVTEMESDAIHICLMPKCLTNFENWSLSTFRLGFKSWLRDYCKIDRLLYLSD